MTILRNCGRGTQLVFTGLGVFVLIFHVLVFLGFLSTFLYVMNVIQPTFRETGIFPSYAIDRNEGRSLFELLSAVCVSGFMTFVFGNIYLLTITTFTRNVLPLKKKPRSTFFSVLLRVCFLVFFAVLISKPIEVMIVQGDIAMDNDVFHHKIELLNQMSPKKIYAADTSANRVGAKIRYTINNGNYFLYKVKLICKEPRYAWTWWISGLFVVLFLLPVFVKQTLRINGDYYTNLKEIQVDIIKRSYKEFKARFTELSADHMGAPLDFYETCEDPPFNTPPKWDGQKFQKQEEFLNLFNRNVRP